jgi:hypothetical protein
MISFRLYAATAVLFMAGTVLPSAWGCTCVQWPSMKAATDAVDIVFRGTITGRSSGPRRDAVFQVEEVWKGPVDERLRVEWKYEEGDCSGFRTDDLKVGAELLVFAKRGQDGAYRTNICYPTKPVSEAGPELKELGPGKRPKG